MYDFDRDTLTPIGNSAGSSQAPLWTADGARVLYRGTRKGTRNLYWRSADGSGEEERLTSKPDVVQTPTSVSADGRWLLFNEGGPNQPGGAGVWVMRLDGDRAPRPFFPEPAGETDGQFSPDGRWIAVPGAGVVPPGDLRGAVSRAGRAGTRSPPTAAPSRSGRATAASCSSRAARS